MLIFTLNTLKNWSYIVFVFVFLSSNTYQSMAQQNLKEDIIVKANCIEIFSTYKAHNSFFFYFKITEIIQGETNDSLILSQEIYSDFGGKQLIEKFKNNNIIILKFSKKENPDENFNVKTFLKKDIPYKSIQLLWAIEPSRKESIQKLQEKLPLTNEKENTYINLLTEDQGKLIYKEKGVQKIAVELFSEYWITATIDE